MRRRLKILAAILLLIGVGIIAYPYVEQFLYAQKASSMMEDHKRSMKQNMDDLKELYAWMDQYNKDLYDSGQSGLVDPFSYQQPVIDLTEWGLYDNIVAFVEIPDMDVTLPVYLGASEENLQKGAAHLSQTSMPIGGKNTNFVIAAHRGYYKAAMFRDITNLELGDKIYVSNYWDTLVYEVIEVDIIDPTEINRIFIQDDRDMITLFTCHPKWEDNERYVVYCERVE